MIRWLLLASNPLPTGRLDQASEIHAILDLVRNENLGKLIHVTSYPAAQKAEFANYLLAHRPHVLQFSGHGERVKSLPSPSREFLPADGESGLLMNSPVNDIALLSAKEMSDVLESLPRSARPRIVLLNACHSYAMAESIGRWSDCVVGMRGPVSDAAALSFSKGFFRWLARGGSVAEAYEEGIREIRSDGNKDTDRPMLVGRQGIDLRRVRLSFPVGLVGRICTLSLFLVLLSLLWIPGSTLPRFIPYHTSILVAGPWLASGRATETKQWLCKALDMLEKYDDESHACVELPRLPASEKDILSWGRWSGASLLLWVNTDGTIRLRPMGILEDHEFYAKGLPDIDLKTVGEAMLHAPLLLSLARLAKQGIAGNPERIRCPNKEVLGSTSSMSLLLLALLTRDFAPGCAWNVEIHSDMLGTCRDLSSVQSQPACALAHISYAKGRPTPLDAEKYLDGVIQHASWPLKRKALVVKARLACERAQWEPRQREQHIKNALDSAWTLWKDSLAASRVSASIPWACARALGTSWSGHQPSDAQVEQFLMQMASQPTEVAPEHLASVRNDRAHWWATVSMWEKAEHELEQACTLSNRYSYRLALAEVRLHRGNEVGALNILTAGGTVSSPSRDEKLRADLLEWLSYCRSKRASEMLAAKDAVIRSYGAFEINEVALAPRNKLHPDDVFTSLECPELSRKPTKTWTIRQVWDVVSAPKNANSLARLNSAMPTLHEEILEGEVPASDKH